MPDLGQDMSHNVTTRVMCIARIITREFLCFQKTDFYFLFDFQHQLTRITVTVSASLVRSETYAFN